MPYFFAPSGLPPDEAKARCRVLAVGAHPDDLEFMCLEPIARRMKAGSFGGLIVTSGAGSLRTGAHAALTDAQYAELRWEEQKAAARIGHYAFVDSLNLQSPQIKDAAGFERLVQSLVAFLGDFHLDEIYLHQPFDRHASHVRVCFAVLEALRRLPSSARPGRILGCEVWRNLDWAPKSAKVLRPLSAADLELQKKLAGVFASQADPQSAKNYVEALVGRKIANAVFQEGLTADAGMAQEIFVDLGEWVFSKRSWKELGEDFVERFRQEAMSSWPAP
jgi:LmbE family N-acetylglucosaminyl deacetylase